MEADSISGSPEVFGSLFFFFLIYWRKLSQHLKPEAILSNVCAVNPLKRKRISFI
jgi:hypothetical protein